MVARPTCTEAQIAQAICDYLRDLQWTTYHEVITTGRGGIGNRADIVAVQGRLVWVIETKTAFNAEVIGQAMAWRPYAHYISVGTPDRRRWDSATQLFLRIVKLDGIGWLTPQPAMGGAWETREARPPRLFRRPPLVDRLRNALREEHKTFATPGTSSRYWTPFKETTRALEQCVVNGPATGVPLKEIVTLIKHHYARNSTAVSCLRDWLLEGRIPQLELVDGVVRRKSQETCHAQKTQEIGR